MRTSTPSCLLVALLLTACGSGDDDAPSDLDAGADGADAAADAAASTDDPWCARLPASTGTDPRPSWVALSRAHAGIRFFGPEDDYAKVDLALAAATDGPADAPFDLSRYAAALGTVCVVRGNAPPLAAVRVESIGTVAIVHPGIGAPTLPPGTTAVAIDLRDLPEAPELPAALQDAVGPALATAIPRPSRTVRIHGGMLDEVFEEDNVYSNTAGTLDRPDISASGAIELPLAVIVGPTLPPEAAELAAALRVAGRAFILGESVPLSVAESRWSRIGDHGLAWRAWEMLDATGDRLPDALAADRADVDVALAELATLGAPPPLAHSSNTRISIGRRYFPEDSLPPALGRGELRAALLIAHGAARFFFPYFDVVGDDIDARLLETMDAVDAADAIDRPLATSLLRRLGAALSDGHNFIFDYGSDTPGRLPLVVDHIDGVPVVLRSLDPDVTPGDSVVAIDGEPVEDWYARELPRTSAATDGYRRDLASRYWLTSTEDRVLDLEAPDGAVRTVTVEPAGALALESLGFAPSLREAGPLSDLGAPDVSYINLSSEVMGSIADFRAALQAAVSARALVIDMRGYPGVDHYEVAAHLLAEAASSPLFRTPIRSTPDDVEIDESSYTINPQGDPSYAGPVALLVGPITVSAAENFSTILVGAHRVTVVGRPSAGTNGNITGVQLPGAFGFSFTGMQVLFPDRSRFHGVGITPDVLVSPTAADVRDGIDTVLEAALQTL